MSGIRRDSVSAVLAFEDGLPDAALVRELGEQLAARFMDSEIILVANGVNDAAAVTLKKLTEDLPDISVLFLSGRVDGDEAVLAGIENAVGDWVLLVDPGRETIAALPRLFDETDKGFDVVVGRAPGARGNSGARGLLQSAYFRAYRALNGVDITADRAPARLLSRAAALHLMRSVDPAGPSGPSRPLVESFAKAIRLLVASGAAPLRFITMTAMAAAGVAMLYSGYVVLIYLFKADVAPGWTTISLQITLLMFVFSAMFAVLAEYVVQIHSSSAARRRHVVSREIRSPKTRRTARLNVVDSAGQYRLGAPADLPESPPELAERSADRAR